MPLELELKFFTEKLPELLKHHEGKFVLIVGRELLGVFDTEDDAYKVGVETRGNVPMLIRQVRKEEPTQNIPALALGLLGVRGDL